MTTSDDPISDVSRAQGEVGRPHRRAARVPRRPAGPARPHPRDQRGARHAAQQRARAVADADGAGLGALRRVGHAVRHRHPRAARRHQLSGQRSLPADDHAVPRRPAPAARRDVPRRPSRRPRRRLPRHQGVRGSISRTASRVGRRLPAHATALGKALLADRFGAERDRHVPGSAGRRSPPTRPPTARFSRSSWRRRGSAATPPTTRRTPRGCGVSPSRWATRGPRRTRSARRCPVARLTPERERAIVEALRTRGRQGDAGAATGRQRRQVVRPVADSTHAVRA